MNGVRDHGLLCLLGVSLALVTLAFLAGTPAQALGEKPVNLAHRGAPASAPENTFAAFDRAISDGADALEIDVRLSADGRLVVIHDGTVDRTTDGSGEVGSLSLDEISGLDAGYRFASGGGYPCRDRGLSVPTLAETLGRYPEVPFNIEIKDKDPQAAREAVRVVSSSDATRRVVLASRDHAVIDEVRDASEGRIPTGASGREALFFVLLGRVGLAPRLDPEYDRLQLPPNYRGFDLITPELIADAGGEGVRVDVWTVNDAARMNRLLDLGVDGIITDRPDVLRSVIASRSRP